MNMFKRMFTALLVALIAFSAIPAQASDDQQATVQAMTMLNINQATAEEIASKMKGVGLKRAQAIVDYRNQFGQFERLEELLDIKGIGAATLEKNRNKLIL